MLRVEWAVASRKGPTTLHLNVASRKSPTLRSTKMATTMRKLLLKVFDNNYSKVMQDWAVTGWEKLLWAVFVPNEKAQ